MCLVNTNNKRSRRQEQQQQRRSRSKTNIVKTASFSSSIESIIEIPNRQDYTQSQIRKMYYTKEELRQAFKKADLEDKFRTVFKKRMPQEHDYRRTSWNVKLESGNEKLNYNVCQW